jgi:hypothetical protein
MEAGMATVLELQGAPTVEVAKALVVAVTVVREAAEHRLHKC